MVKYEFYVNQYLGSAIPEKAFSGVAAQAQQHFPLSALFELLKTKNLPDITTTEIIKKAGVCRSSFYRNFYLTEDVIRQYGTALYEEINRQIPLNRDGIYEHILGHLIIL